MIAVAHPDLFAARVKPPLEQGQPVSCRCHIGPAELCRALTTLHLAAQAVHHHLLAIADAQHRHAQVKDRPWRHRRTFGKDRGRPARKDDRLWRKLCQEAVRHLLERMNLAVDVQLAQASRNQLRYLAAEIDDQKAVMLGHPRGIAAGGALRKGRWRAAPHRPAGAVLNAQHPRRMAVNRKRAGTAQA